MSRISSLFLCQCLFHLIFSSYRCTLWSGRVIWWWGSILWTFSFFWSPASATTLTTPAITTSTRSVGFRSYSICLFHVSLSPVPFSLFLHLYVILSLHSVFFPVHVMHCCDCLHMDHASFIFIVSSFLFHNNTGFYQFLTVPDHMIRNIMYHSVMWMGWDGMYLDPTIAPFQCLCDAVGKSYFLLLAPPGQTVVFQSRSRMDNRLICWWLDSVARVIYEDMTYLTGRLSWCWERA